jgi:hypothetical protein
MAIGPAKGKIRRAKNGVSAGEGARAVIVTAAFAGILILAIFVTAGSYLSPERVDNKSVAKITPLPPSIEQSAAAHRAAAIVVETDKKGRCEERRFDNRTGKIVSSNFVDCEARLERDTTPSETINSERIRTILGAFKR